MTRRARDGGDAEPAGSAPSTGGRVVWRSSFSVPAAAVDAVWWTLADAVLNVSAFEEDADGRDGGGPWRIELLHEEPPDRAALEAELAALAAAHGLAPVRLEVEPVPPTDWLIEVARRFPPTRIGRFFIHGGDRDAGEPAPPGTVPIRIDPGQAFGSGEHATTRGCLLAIDGLARTRRVRRALDLGCGSGVLAIAAAKAWPASRALAADNDPVAVAVAAENAAQNGVAGRVRAVQGEGYAHPALGAHGPYDLILANILADPLRDLARATARHLAPGGAAVLSGLLDRQADAVARAHRPYGLRLRRTILIGPWATLVLTAPTAGRRRATRL